MVLDEHVIDVTTDEDVYGTRENDRFVINNETGDNAVIYAGNKGVDTLDFDFGNLFAVRAIASEGSKDLTIRYYLNNTTSRTLVIKDYFSSTKHNNSKSSLKNIHYIDRTGTELDGSIMDILTFENTYTIKGSKITGSKFNDKIDVSTQNDGYTIIGGNGKDLLAGSQGDDIINGGKGDDRIGGNQGNDVLIGGAGNNTYLYDGPGDGDDIIKLTKKENFTLDIGSNIDGDLDNMAYVLDDKGNAEIIIDNTDPTKGKITLTGFAKKDSTTGALLTGSSLADTDLKTDVTWDKVITKNYKGSYLNENISAAGYKIRNKNGDDVAWTDKLKGLKINGKSGNDNITGSDYIDTIKAGKGELNTITGGKGNDKLYAGTDEGSNTTFNFSAGDGHDTVYGGKGNDTLNFEGIDVSDVEFERAKDKKGRDTRDLIIRYNHNDEGVAQDSVLIKNYYDKNGNIVSSVRNFSINDVVYNNILKEAGTYIAGFPNGSYRISGTDGNDIIMATQTSDGLTQSIYGGNGDDIIYTSSSTSSVITGEGNNTVFLNDPGDGHPNFLYTGSGNDTIYGAETKSIIYVFADGELNTTAGNLGNDTFYYRGGGLNLQCYKKDMYDHSLFTRNGNDLTYRYQNSTLTIKDYFLLSEAEQNKFILQIHDTEDHVETLTFNAFAELKGGVLNYVSSQATDNYIVSEENINGTDGSDLIFGTNISTTPTTAQNIIAGAGDDIIICSENAKAYVECGSGNDTVYGTNYNEGGFHTYKLDSGNNTLYLGNGIGANVYLGTGNDTIYAKENLDGMLIHVNQYTATEDSGNNTLHWASGMINSQLRFNKSVYDDIGVVREEGSNDLKITYGTNSSITIKDYYITKPLISPRVYSLEEANSATLITKTLSNMIIDKGGAGDDLYTVGNIGEKTTFADNGGNDVLNINGNISGLRAFFNIKKDGTFAEGQDKLFITNTTTFDSWTTGTAPATGIEINDFDSIERINAYNNYYMTTTQLNQLKDAVAGWLAAANNGEGYADVATALGSAEAANLIAIFNNNTCWQQQQA